VENASVTSWWVSGWFRGAAVTAAASRLRYRKDARVSGGGSLWSDTKSPSDCDAGASWGMGGGHGMAAPLLSVAVADEQRDLMALEIHAGVALLPVAAPACRTMMRPP